MLDDNASNPARITEQIGGEQYINFAPDRYLMQVLLFMTT